MKKLCNNAGFTLVEIICAIALLSVISVSSYSVFTGTAIGQRKSGRQLDANAIAQAVMEDLIETAPNLTQADFDTLDDKYSGRYTPYPIQVTADRANTTLLQAKYKDYQFVQTLPPLKPGNSDPPSYTPPPGGMMSPGPKFSDYNAQIEIFDYCDYDYYDIIKTGLILIYREDSSKIDFDKLFSIDSFAEFDKYKNEIQSLKNQTTNPASFKHFEDSEALLAKYGITSARYEWLKPCFVQLDVDDIAFLLDHIMSQYKKELDMSLAELLDNWGSAASDWSQTGKEINQQKWLNLLKAEPKHCYHIERGWKCTYNVFENLSYCVDNFVNVTETEHRYSWGSQYEYKYELNDEFYQSSVFKDTGRPDNIKNALENVYSYLNRHHFHGKTTTGPWLVMKFYNREKGIITLNDNKKLIFITPTEQGSDRQDIYFQIYPRQLVFQKGGLTFSTEPDKNVLGIDTMDIPRWNGSSVWYQENIFQHMVFYVTGGLTYRETTFGLFGDGTGFIDEDGDTYPDVYNPETGKIESSVKWKTDEKGEPLWFKANAKGEYIVDEEGNCILAEPGDQYKLRLMDSYPFSLQFYRGLIYDYVHKYNTRQDKDATTLLNLTDFTKEKPSWFGLNWNPPINKGGPPGNTPPPTPSPDPGNNGGDTPISELEGNQGELFRFRVDVYDPDDPDHKKAPLATLVAYSTVGGSLKFSMTSTPAPTSSSGGSGGSSTPAPTGGGSGGPGGSSTPAPTGGGSGGPGGSSTPAPTSGGSGGPGGGSGGDDDKGGTQTSAPSNNNTPTPFKTPTPTKTPSHNPAPTPTSQGWFQLSTKPPVTTKTENTIYVDFGDNDTVTVFYPDGHSQTSYSVTRFKIAFRGNSGDLWFGEGIDCSETSGREGFSKNSSGNISNINVVFRGTLSKNVNVVLGIWGGSSTKYVFSNRTSGASLSIDDSEVKNCTWASVDLTIN